MNQRNPNARGRQAPSGSDTASASGASWKTVPENSRSNSWHETTVPWLVPARKSMTCVSSTFARSARRPELEGVPSRSTPRHGIVSFARVMRLT